MTRRCFVSLAGAALAKPALAADPPSRKRRVALPKGTFPADYVRYRDPVTEFPVVRLTAPSYRSFLPDPHNRFISANGRFLLMVSDREGRAAVYRFDLRNGQSQRLAAAPDVVPGSLTMDREERNCFFVNARSLTAAELGAGTSRTLAEDVDGFDLMPQGAGLLVWRTGRLEALMEGQGRRVIAEDAVSRGLISPDGRFALFLRSGGELWRVPLDGRGSPERLAPPQVFCPGWEPDGTGVLALRDRSSGRFRFSELVEVLVGGPQERVVAETSQFVTFSQNRDGSVLAAASRSKAQPHVLIFLRLTRRELTICEHRASDPHSVAPVFAPNSRRLYFQSDRDGKPAIYTVNVEQLVEPTDT